jgi:hypothetical protein
VKSWAAACVEVPYPPMLTLGLVACLHIDADSYSFIML